MKTLSLTFEEPFFQQSGERIHVTPNESTVEEHTSLVFALDDRRFGQLKGQEDG